MKNIFMIMIIMSLFNLQAINTDITFGMQEANIGNYKKADYYITINLEQNIKNFYVYGSYTNEFIFNGKNRFRPRMDYFTIGVMYDFNFADIKLEHMCMHPVVAGVGWDGIFGGYTKFEITIGD